MTEAKAHSAYGLENHGLRNPKAVHWNLTQAALIEHAVRKDEGALTRFGPLVVNTGQHTGRTGHPDFVARSRLNPAAELINHEAWCRLWIDAFENPRGFVGHRGE